MGRPKLERTVLQARTDKSTPDTLKQMALQLGFQYGSDGNTGKFLDAIALLNVEDIRKLIEES